MDNIDKVVDFINVQRDRYVDELKQYLAIPSISALPAAPGRRAALRRVDAPTTCGGSAWRTCRLIETPGNPDRLRRVAGRARRADDPLLRPLRRAAGRSGRVVGVAAVRGDGARGRDLRARRRRRQGPGLHALQGHRGPHEADRPPAAEHQGSSRRRRRSRQRCISTSSCASNKPLLAADVVVISDSAMFARGMPSICYGLRGLVYYQIDLRGTQERPALGRRSAARWRIPRSCSRRSWRR